MPHLSPLLRLLHLRGARRSRRARRVTLADVLTLWSTAHRPANDNAAEGVASLPVPHSRSVPR